MKNIIILITFFMINACAIGSGENSEIVANKNNFFPKVSGINLEGEIKKLPESFDKKLNIVVVAFQREQQREVDTWIKVADEILAKNPEIGFYELPVIYEVNPLYRAFINNGMRRGIDDVKARARTITVYTDRDKFFVMMNMVENKIYTLLIDQKGEILWKSEGVAEASKIKSLTSFIKKSK